MRACCSCTVVSIGLRCKFFSFFFLSFSGRDVHTCASGFKCSCYVEKCTVLNDCLPDTFYQGVDYTFVAIAQSHFGTVTKRSTVNSGPKIGV